MKKQHVAIILVILATFAIAFTPVNYSDAEVSNEDISVVLPSDDSEIYIHAGNSGSFNLVVTNLLPFVSNNTDNTRSIQINIVDSNGISGLATKDFFILEGQRYETVNVVLSVDEFASTGEYSSEIQISIKSLDASLDAQQKSIYITVDVESPLSSGGAYNKILGVFDNPLPDPFNQPIFTAMITFLLIIVIGLVILAVIFPIIIRIVGREHKEEGRSVVKSVKFLILLIILLFAFDKSLRVYGTAESIISSVNMWFNIAYIIVGAIIIWNIYLKFVKFILRNVNKEFAEEEDAYNDLEPLFRLLGKLLIAVIAVAMAMASLGFDLTAIIASAGIMSLGITLGAQNILNQFFCGLTLLSTRPFKKDDLIRIGTDVSVYRVKTVNIMTSTFSSWDNEEEVVMPNNMVSSSKIVNVTSENLLYRIHIFMGVAYGEDTDKARQLMLDIAMANSNVVTDGSAGMPFTRITSLNSSEIEIRLTVTVDNYEFHGTIGGNLREAMYKSFVENDIDIPFPQLDVHIDHVNEKT